MTDYDAKKIAEELRTLEVVKKDRDYYKKQAEELQEEIRRKNKEEMKVKNTLILGGLHGIEIPLDDAVRAELNNYIYKEIRNVIDQIKTLRISLSKKR